MVVTLLVALALSQAPTRQPIAVVVSSQRPGADAFSSKLAERLREALVEAGFEAPLGDAEALQQLTAQGAADPRRCQGRSSCLSQLATLLGPRAVVVGLDVGKVAKSLAIHVEAVGSGEEGVLLASDSSATVSDWSGRARESFSSFSKELATRLRDPDAPVAAAPKVTRRSRHEAPAATTLVTAQPAPLATESKPLAPWLFTGGAVALAGAGVALGITGWQDRTRYESSLYATPGGGQGSTLTQAQANALAGSANTKLTLALTSAVLSAALGGIGAYLFHKEP